MRLGILRGKQVIEVNDFLRCKPEQIAEDILGDFRISTAFLGVSTYCGNWFETMVFCENASSGMMDLHNFCVRSETYANAIEKHSEVLEMVINRMQETGRVGFNFMKMLEKI